MNEWPVNQGHAARPRGDEPQDAHARPERPEHPEPRAAAAGTSTFYRELIEVQIECDELVSALERRDPIDVEIAACDLASTWLAAQAAVKAIEAAALDAREQRDAAILVLRASWNRLLQLFGRALAETSQWGASAPRLHDLLQRLGASLLLSIAHSEPPASNTTGSP